MYIKYKYVYIYITNKTCYTAHGTELCSVLRGQLYFCDQLILLYSRN